MGSLALLSQESLMVLLLFCSLLILNKPFETELNKSVEITYTVVISIFFSMSDSQVGCIFQALAWVYCCRKLLGLQEMVKDSFFLGERKDSPFWKIF